MPLVSWCIFTALMCIIVHTGFIVHMSRVTLAGDRVSKLVGELVPHIDSAGAIERVRNSQAVLVILCLRVSISVTHGKVWIMRRHQVIICVKHRKFCFRKCSYSMLLVDFCIPGFNMVGSLVPRHGGGGGERVPGIHCLCMCLIAMEFRGDRVRTCTYVYWWHHNIATLCASWCSVWVTFILGILVARYLKI